MKSILSIILIFSISFLFAQNDNFSNNQSSTSTGISSPFNNSFGGSTYYTNPKEFVMGSIYLYDNWENTGIVYTITNQKFVLQNINLNIERNAFQVKISKDSIFTYNFNNIEKFEVKNKVFKNFYSEDGKRIYEIIYESDDFTILKGFHIEFVDGSANPMVNRPNARYIRKTTYYLRRSSSIKPYKLSKKKIVKLIEDQDRVAKLVQFMDDNKLSYKKSEDLKKGLEYSALN